MTQTEHLDQAADWFDRFDELDQQGKVELSVWLAVPAHQQAFSRIARAIGQPEVAAAAINIANELTQQQQLVAPIPAPVVSKPKLVNSWYAMAASFVAIAVLLSLISVNDESVIATADNRAPRVISQSLEMVSAKGQPLSQALRDGSMVYLNGDSQITVNHSAEWREVRLNKGQAYFNVAHEPDRPFVVNVDDARVQVVGTAFDIDRLADKTIFRVYEGVVKVFADKSLMLLKGEGVILEDGKWSHTFRLDQDQLPEWRSGWMEVRNETLGTVIERFSRYLDKPVVIQGSAHITLSGRFKLNQPEESLKLLASAEGLTLKEHGDRFVLTSSN